ncbi:MAG TPA: CopG family transcriptional regulator [Acidimicrobiales bacterium]|nr:CopG family transcriptional regulator [Acidimicrobiales bacterium]
MHRTNLYLTEEQEEKLDARARAAGVSRSALVRSIIDRELDRPLPVDESVAETLGHLADRYHAAVQGLFGDDPDLRVDR